MRNNTNLYLAMRQVNGRRSTVGNNHNKLNTNGLRSTGRQLTILMSNGRLSTVDTNDKKM